MAKTIVQEEKQTTPINVQKMRDKDKQMVRGIFHYHDNKGGTLEFMFKKYSGDVLTKYVMRDGAVYTIPRAVANHLNTNCYVPVHGHIQNEDKTFGCHVSDKIYRTGFSGIDFMDIDDMQDVSQPMNGVPALGV